MNFCNKNSKNYNRRRTDAVRVLHFANQSSNLTKLRILETRFFKTIGKFIGEMSALFNRRVRKTRPPKAFITSAGLYASKVSTSLSRSMRVRSSRKSIHELLFPWSFDIRGISGRIVHPPTCGKSTCDKWTTGDSYKSRAIIQGWLATCIYAKDRDYPSKQTQGVHFRFCQRRLGKDHSFFT